MTKWEAKQTFMWDGERMYTKCAYDFLDSLSHLDPDMQSPRNRNMTVGREINIMRKALKNFGRTCDYYVGMSFARMRAKYDKYLQRNSSGDLKE